MIVHVRNSLLFLLLFLPACASDDQIDLYHNASIERMPRGLDDLRLVKSDSRLSELTTPLSGHRSILRYTANFSGVPLINDSASRRTVIIVFDQRSPVPGRSGVGSGVLAAYLTSGAPSRPVGAYCLGMATTGFVDVKIRKQGLYDVEFDLKFSEISGAGFKDVCPEERIVKSVRKLKPTDLMRPSSQGG
ncbi:MULTISPECIES: hypothetical protein [Lysobacter]|uniref:hypothetical protein n=1 Tax=Lysobacter TaxID=68 RepID=UPI001F216716|nr:MULTISPECIES: hypothetical protein [Lysobacter]UJB18105.1 hypothetical protein L1A79_17355 [Lysobacter capsici]UJQ28172.1 hypothetical protein L2D09_22530 [Lysobacter gummosus]